MSTEISTNKENQTEQNDNSNLDLRPRYWQTIEEWRMDPEFQKLAEKEFTSSPLAKDVGDEASQDGGWARREFLKLMGASLALTSFGCVRRPATKIVPYVKRPVEVVEGLANYYASSFVDGSETFGVVVTTREGRPIHVTGNKLHPVNNGGMSARAHAHLLALYDPARLKGPTRNLQNDKRSNRDTINTSYEKADKEIAAQLKKGGVAVLSGSVVSPSLDKVLADFVRGANAKTYTWEPLSQEAYTRAQELAYGMRSAPRLAVDKAQFILAVNNDFLGTFLQPTQQTNAFAKTRNPNGNMSELVVFESLMSLTGANADSRFRIRPSQSLDVLMGVLYELAFNKKVTSAANDSAIKSVLAGYDKVEDDLGLAAGTIAQVATKLWENKGRGLVLGGTDLESQLAACLLNSLVGNDGVTVDYARSPNRGFQGSTADLSALVADMQSGRVKTLIVHGVNPLYSAPSDLNLKAALQKVETIIYTGDRNDETGIVSDYVLPDHHPMEGWGDHEGQKGIYSIQQPTIAPLYNTRAFGDSLITWGKAVGYSGFAGYDSFHEVVKSQVEGRLNRDWTQSLQDGVIDSLGAARNSTSGARSFRDAALTYLKKQNTPKADLELVLYPTVGLKDGSLANVTWMQEFPDPVTKICWDNYICVSPKVATEKHLKEGQVAKLTVGDKEISAPIHIQPGQDDRAIGIAIGYGRTNAGDVANGVGVNAYNLASIKDGMTRYAGLSATLTPTKTMAQLAGTQGHHNMMGRQIVVEATLAQYKENPEANIHRHKVFSAWSGHEYKGHKWGMSIDLNKCTGCSACVIACQSENNISVVGKKYVALGRIMHWIRIDRYFVGDEHNPDVVQMPILCQHCDNAPCETVCPVAATTHSDEGVNDMTYNRCVGTRYCANNCPYKVRRFNWFNYARMNPELAASPLHMQLNPDVAVRERGVMEKCSFCTHKIKAAKTKAKLEDRVLNDGDVLTACQAACPAEAIVFGDMNNKESRVSVALQDKRHYSLLEELNTRPAIQYASKIRNTDKLKGQKGHGSHAKGGH